MSLYCGIDLHSNNHVITIIDENDNRLFERRMPNKLETTLNCLSEYQDDVAGIAVESTYTGTGWLTVSWMPATYCIS